MTKSASYIVSAPPIPTQYGAGLPRSALRSGEWEPAHPWSPWRLVGYDLFRRVYRRVHDDTLQEQAPLFKERASSKYMARAALYSMFASPEPPRGGRMPKI